MNTDEKIFFAIARATKAAEYGADMETSKLLCIEDAISLLQKVKEEISK